MAVPELILRFPSATQVTVAFGCTDCGPLQFDNPITEQDRKDIRWYIETYGAQSLADPDDHDTMRIEARLAGLGKGLFTAVFSQLEATERYREFRGHGSDHRILTMSPSRETVRVFREHSQPDDSRRLGRR